MDKKIYSEEEIQAIANSIRKQILGIALRTGGCYLAQACSSAEIVASLYTNVMNLGPSEGLWEPIPFPGVPGPDNMDYPKGMMYNGAPAPDKDRFFVSCCHSVFGSAGGSGTAGASGITGGSGIVVFSCSSFS